jgi:hypothetical protein
MAERSEPRSGALDSAAKRNYPTPFETFNVRASPAAIATQRDPDITIPS